MELKVICPTCKGEGYLDYEICNGLLLGSAKSECKNCQGKGYTNPPQEILDDLECAEIERELLEKGYHVSINQFKYNEELSLCLTLHYGKDLVFSVFNEHKETKLEALRKAKKWIEGRQQ